MIYGINFNGTEIPPAIKRRFAQTTRCTCFLCGGLGYHRRNTVADEEEREPCTECRRSGKLTYHLKGVATGGREERDAMLIQANNGHRRLFVVNRQTAGGVFHGIYIY